MICGVCGKTIWAAEGQPCICACQKKADDKSLLDKLPTFDPSKPAICGQIDGIHDICVNREEARQAVFVGHARFKRLLVDGGWPQGHEIEAVEITKYPQAPGILLSIEGPLCMKSPEGGPLCIELIDKFLARDTDEVRAAIFQHRVKELLERGG